MSKDIILEGGCYPVRSPESQGIPSQAVLEFLNAVEAQEIDMHSLYIFKNGYQIAGGCRSPFQPDSLHRIYSGAKAINALAVLFAIQEGLLSLNDRIVDVFAEELTDITDPMVRKVTLYHMLTMTTGQDQDCFRPLLNGEDSLHGFFSVPIEYEPGTHFLYNNGVPHMLGLIIEKVTGQDYISYLKPRLLDPLGIYCTVEKTEKGELEGSRTVCTPDGFTKLTLFFLQEGRWNGQQLLRADLMRQASSFQVPSTKCSSISFPHVDELAGYGFQVWRNSVGGYRLDGGRSQFGFCFPEYDFALVCNCIEADSSLVPSTLWRTLFAYISGSQPLDEGPDALAAQQELTERLIHWSCAPACLPEPEHMDDYYDRVCVWEENPYGIVETQLHLDGSVPIVTLRTASESCEVKVGLAGEWEENTSFISMPRQNERLNTVFGVTENIYYVSGGWLTDFCFLFQVREKGWMDYNTFYLRFNQGKGSMIVESNMEKLHHLRKRIPTKVQEYSDAPIDGILL